MMKQNSNTFLLHDRIDKIITGIPPGSKLPSEPELARSLGVSRATLRESMRTFETQGRIRRRQGSGTFVTHTSSVIESGLEALESIEALASRIGLQVSMGECQIEMRSCSDIELLALNLVGESKVWKITRVIHAEGRPVAYLIDVVPVGILNESDLTNNFSGSILDLIIKNGRYLPQLSRTDINAVTVSHDIARSMGIQRGDVLLFFSACLYDINGLAIDYSLSYFLPGYFKFHVVRRVGKI